jgi:hypothetical protein
MFANIMEMPFICRLAAALERTWEILKMAYLTVFTTMGAEAVVDVLDTNVNTWVDSGTGITEAAIGQTALVTPWGGARVSATQTQPSASVWRHVATTAYNNIFAITEAGLFDALTLGNMYVRGNFAAINVVSGDSIEFTINLTVA